MNLKLHIFCRGVDLPLDLPPGLPELSRVGIYQYESQIAVFCRGVDVPFDLAPGLHELSRVGFYHYESQIAVF